MKKKNYWYSIHVFYGIKTKPIEHHEMHRIITLNRKIKTKEDLEQIKNWLFDEEYCECETSDILYNYCGKTRDCIDFELV